MDGGGAPKTGMKISFIVVIVCAVVCLVCYVYGSWADAKAQEEMIPKLAADSLVGAVRKYQKATGQFPNDFAEVAARNHKPVSQFGANKRTLLDHNYYYVYTKVDPLTCAIWAIPSGPKREVASTVFLVVGVDTIRNWKGPSLSKADIEKLPMVPTNDQLNVMGMTEQPRVNQQAANNAASR